MSENNSNDATNVLSNGATTHFNTENVVLTVADDIQKWYAKQQNQVYDTTETSRLSTAIEQPDTDGLVTAEEPIEGLQTNLEDKSLDVVDEDTFNKLQTVRKDDDKSNSRLSTEMDEKAIDDAKLDIKKDNQSHTNKLQTTVDKAEKANKLSEKATKGIKVVKGVNKAGKYIARAGKRLQTASEDGNVGTTFADDIKYASGKTVGKVAKVATKKIRSKIAMKTTQLMAKVMKAVVKVVSKLAQSLIQIIAETAPVSIPIIAVVLVVVIIVAVIAGINPVFAENSSEETKTSYASYITNYEGEHSVNVDWYFPLAYIYFLDDNIQYDEGEQYLLNQFDSNGLLVSSSSISDYVTFFENHNDVIVEFYNLSGITDYEIDTDSLEESVRDLQDDKEDFLSEINKYLEEYENNYTGTGNGKFIYPTTITTISAGYPNYDNGDYHGGVDFAVPLGTPVGASADGVVVISTDITSHSNCHCSYTSGGYHSYGRYIVIDHGDGVRTYYCHLSERYVNVGDTVKQGQIIGKSGSTGNSSGPHCHFEVRVNNTRVNPLTYLDSN